MNEKTWIRDLVLYLLLALALIFAVVSSSNSKGYRSEIRGIEEDLSRAQRAEREAVAALERAEGRAADLEAINLAAAREIERISEDNRKLAANNLALEQRLDLLEGSVSDSGELIDRGLRILDELEAEDRSGDLDK